MKFLITTILVVILAGCTGHMNHEYNPLEGPGSVTELTTISPSSAEDMVFIEAHIKRLLNKQGIKDVYVYWEINDALKKGNMAVYDITLSVGDGPKQRFLFGLTNGVVDMTKEIEPEAEVQCDHEAEQYEGRDQA